VRGVRSRDNECLAALVRSRGGGQVGHDFKLQKAARQRVALVVALLWRQHNLISTSFPEALRIMTDVAVLSTPVLYYEVKPVYQGYER